MKPLLLYFSLILVMTSISASAQTASDLDSKYGAAQQSYEIRPGIFMNVKYSDDGGVCEMAIEKRHLRGSGTVDLDPTIISPEEIKVIVDELAPGDKRGKENKFSGDIAFIGGSTAVFEYENCRLVYYGNQMDGKYSGTVAIVIQWKKRICKG